MKKRLVALSLSLALLVSFCGCSGKKTTSEYTEYESVVDSTGLSDNSQSGGSKTESGSNGGTSSTGGGTTSVPKYTKPNKPSTSATDTSGHKVELANPVYIAEGTKAMDEGLNFGGKTFTMAKRSDENYTQGRFSRLVAAFEKKYNCKIKTSELEFNSYVTLVTNAKASGTPYDIIFGHGSMFPSLPMGGVLNDLSEYFTTADYDTGKGGKIHEAQSVFRQAGSVPAVGDEAEAAGEGDGKAYGRRCAHGPAHVHVVPDEEGNGERSAAYAYEAGHRADDHARARHARKAGQGAACTGLFVQQHVGGHIIQEYHEEHLKIAARNTRCDEGAAVGSYENAYGDAAEYMPVHAAVSVMGHGAGYGGEHDAAERGAHGHMHGHVR